jgi:hypothetical protein
MFLALLTGLGTLVVGLLLYGGATALIVLWVVPRLRKKPVRRVVYRNFAIMVVISVATALVHLTQVTLWAAVYLLVGEIETFETAFYCSAQNYTALGYGDVVLSARWRLLGPLEAMNGLLLVGLSTAVMFAIMSRLIANRLHLQLEMPHDTLND